MKRSWIQRKPDAKRLRTRRTLVAHRYHSIDTRVGLKDELHRVTSLIVRKRDGCCVICGSTSDLQAGHFYKRTYLAIAFDLRNVNTQCGFHNLLHNENPFPYMAFMQKTYGEDVVCELNELRMKPIYIPTPTLRELLDSHRQLLREMSKAA